MTTGLRARMIILFVSLVVFIYVVDSAASFILFEHTLTANMKVNVDRLCQEIVPAITFEDGVPTLRSWYALAQKRHIHAFESLQLFSAEGKLLEQIGLSGIPHLKQGYVSDTVSGQKLTFYSNFKPIAGSGFVQIQVPVESYEESALNYSVAKLLRILIISLAIGLSAWFYSGKAIAPAVRSFDTLRSFVRDAGHELNTPVTLIEQSVETLEAHLQDRGMPTDVLEIIRHASHRLKSLAHDLLFLAKMEQPDVVFNKTLVDACAIAASAAEDFTGRAASKGITLKVNPLPKLSVLADEDALARVFTNLIENAIRYTPAGGKISIQGSRHETRAAITVTDTGVGIPETSLPFIFDRFYRVDKARSRQVGGSGLGLSIVKAIIDAHGGSIRVWSEPGKGSEFTVLLPLA